MKKIAFLLLVGLLVGSNVSAQVLDVNFAGFTFKGNAAELGNLYPYVYEISQEVLADNRLVLNAAISERLKNVVLDNVKIHLEFAEIDKRPLTLALCFDNESIAIESYDQGYKLGIILSAQAVLFNFKERKIIANFPLMVELIDFVETEPDSALIKSRIRDLFLTDKYKINLLDDFIDVLQHANIKENYGSTIQVSEVIVEEKALSELPPKYRDNLGNFKSHVAQSFGKYLSLNQGVSILPFSHGTDTFQMAGRFSDAKAYDLLLSIPEPSFKTEITVRGFKKVCTDTKSSGSCWVYGSYIRLKLYQQLLGKVYLDEKFKHGVDKIIPKTLSDFEDWPAYQNSLSALFYKLTKDFSDEPQFKEVREVLDRCR